MKTIRISRENGAETKNVAAATIGHYDGVHLGHQHVLRCLHARAEEKGIGETMVITFDRHPRTLFDKSYKPQMLTTIEERQEYLEQCGIDTCVVLEFDEAMASLSAYDFMREILRDRLGVSLLLLGYDNHFGRRKQGESFEDYRRYGRELGIEVVLCDGIAMPDGTHYSSTEVRKLLAGGHCRRAMQCLGRPYSLRGIVVEGFHEGRKIGFPTANIRYPEGKFVIKRGVYETAATIDGKEYKGITNFGARPTFFNDAVITETHFLNFSGDLYGKTLTIYFKRFLRDISAFKSAEELKKQLDSDKRRVLSGD